MTWTVNEDDMMRWSINKELDGVITDDPKRFNEVCDEWTAGKREVHAGPQTWLMVLWIQFMLLVFGALFRWKYRDTKQKLAGNRVVLGIKGTSPG